QRTQDDRTTGTFDGRREEYLCDGGAAHILLHPSWLRDLAVVHEPSLERLFAAAAACEASAEATARQLAVLGVWECAFVFWEPGYRKSEQALIGRAPLPGFEPVAAEPIPKLRATRVYRPDGTPFFPRRKSVDEDTSIAEALRDEVRTRAVERFDLGGQHLIADCESQYVGYTRGDGTRVPRVL